MTLRPLIPAKLDLKKDENLEILWKDGRRRRLHALVPALNVPVRGLQASPPGAIGAEIAAEGETWVSR